MKKISILLFLSFFFSEGALAEDRYFAVTKVSNSTNGITSVTIVMANDKKDCRSLLDGAIEGNKQFGEVMRIVSSECLVKLPENYLRSFNNKSIRGVLYVAYINIIWPSRVLMYGLDESWLSGQGCASFAEAYKSIDKNVRCVYGAK